MESELEKLILSFIKYRKKCREKKNLFGVLILCGPEDSDILEKATEIYEVNDSDDEVLASDEFTDVCLLLKGNVNISNKFDNAMDALHANENFKIFIYNPAHIIDERSLEHLKNANDMENFIIVEDYENN